MNTSIISGLINNAALLITMGLLYDMLFLREPARKPLNQFVIGTILGTIGIGVMLNPWVFMPGVIFDTRSVLLCITGYFFGPIPTLTATLMTAAYRMIIGGAGVWMGVAVIATSAGVGLLWRYRRKAPMSAVSTSELYALGLTTHFLMLLWTITLPGNFALGVLSKISLPVMLIFPLLTVLLGKLMLNRSERSSMARSIRESEEKYRELVESANSIILKWTRQGRIRFMNEYGLRFFGYRPDEILGKPIVGAILADAETGRQDPNEMLDGIFENPSRHANHLCENIRKDGSRAWVEWTYHPIRDKNGCVTGMLSVGTDNTDRIRAEKALAKSESKWRNVLVNTPLIGISLDTQGTIVFANDHFLQLTGWKAKEVIRQNWFDMFVPRDIRENVRGIFDTVVNHKDTLEFSNYENEILTKNGELRSVEWSNVLTKDVHGNVVDITCLGVDLTERKQALQLLQESAEYHQELFDNSPTALYLQDYSNVEARLKSLQGVENLGAYLRDNPQEVTRMEQSVVITTVNKAAADLYGADSPEALTNGLDRLLVENDRRFFIEQIVDLANGIDRYEAEARTRTVAGKEIDLIVRKRVLHRERNGLSKILVSLTDITGLLQAYRDREKLKARLQQAQKMEAIGNLAGGIAHDFNNILFPIMGLSELLLDDFSPGSQEHEHLSGIMEASKRGRDLVNQILVFGRKSERKMIPVLMRQVVEEVVQLIRSTIPSNIDIAQDFRLNGGRIMADPTQVHQIVMNLITNAYHALEPDGGQISIQLTETELSAGDVSEAGAGPGRYVVMNVSDTGRGIAPDAIDKIFDPYFTTKGQGKGTGLGLSVVYGIIREYGGEIKVHSELGKGTTFDVWFPVIGEEIQVDRSDGTEAVVGGTERILLVDDEASIADLQKKMLERLGYRANPFTSSTAALSAFKANPDHFDLVITDMAMPDMSGDRLAREVMAIRPTIPVIVCTGFSNHLDRHAAEKMGISGFLTKPIHRNDMARMVRKALDRVDSPRPQ